MVEIRVAVPDPVQSHGLIRRFIDLFGRSSVTFDRAHNEVCIRSEWGSRSFVQVVDMVQSWLTSDSVGPVRLSVGDHSYLVGDGFLAPAGAPIE